MAGNKDELVGSDDQVNILTDPKPKRTYQDVWNAAYRGLVPHGMNAYPKNGGGAPALPDGGPDAEPFSETEPDNFEPEIPEPIETQPVVIIDDLSRVRGSSELHFHSYQVQVGPVGTTLVVNKDVTRTRVVLLNIGPGVIYLGSTESVGTSGAVLLPSATSGVVHEREIFTTQEIWAMQGSGESSNAILHVIVEYTKEF
ncbi:MAG: hypothetical protein AB7I44_21150 [Hyphomicrobiaceae bacterium]